MEREPFNPDDPWHAWANFLFNFDCDSCDATVLFDWPNAPVNQSMNDADADFLAACVEVSNRAKAQGWTCIDGEQVFRCGKCSSRP